MIARGNRARAAVVLATVALCGGLLAASGTGSTSRSWTWEAEVPGGPVSGSSDVRLLTLDVLFDDGHVEAVTPTQGFVLLPLPPGTTSEASSVAKIVGRDASRNEIATYRPGRAP